MLSSRAKLCVLALALGGAASCTGATPAVTNHPVAPFVGGRSASVRSSTLRLYVADENAVTVYAAGSNTVLRTVSGVTPSAIAIDGSGNLYVANVPAGQHGNVAVYRAQTNDVLRKITDGIDEPKAMAFDGLGDLYVANAYFRVNSYPPGKSEPAGSIRIFFPDAIAFDGANDAYVARAPSPYGGQGKSEVDVYGPDLKELRQIVRRLNTPVALAFGGNGNLFVANFDGNTVTAYAAGKTILIRTISQGVNGPYDIVFDSGGNLYVSNYLASTVTVYAPGTSTVKSTIRQGISHPTALLVDASNDLYVANAKSVTEYAPGATSPSRTIVNGIKNPIAMAFGP